VNVPEMGGEAAEMYLGLEAGFRLHVSATFVAIKVWDPCTPLLQRQRERQLPPPQWAGSTCCGDEPIAPLLRMRAPSDPFGAGHADPSMTDPTNCAAAA
jgi:hypothetical protein